LVAKKPPEKDEQQAERDNFDEVILRRARTRDGEVRKRRKQFAVS
jgi:hypothetical protein